MKWHLLEVHRRPGNLVVTAVEGCRLLCSSPALAPSLAFPACCWLCQVLSGLSPWMWKLGTAVFWLMGSSSPLSDYNESRQLSPVVPPFKSLWQHHRCFFFPCLSPPGSWFDSYLLAFVFKSARVGKTRSVKKLIKELGSCHHAAS